MPTTLRELSTLGPMVASPDLIGRILSFADKETALACLTVGKIWYRESVQELLYDIRIDLDKHPNIVEFLNCIGERLGLEKGDAWRFVKDIRVHRHTKCLDQVLETPSDISLSMTVCDDLVTFCPHGRLCRVICCPQAHQLVLQPDYYWMKVDEDEDGQRKLIPRDKGPPPPKIERLIVNWTQGSNDRILQMQSREDLLTILESHWGVGFDEFILQLCFVAWDPKTACEDIEDVDWLIDHYMTSLSRVQGLKRVKMVNVGGLIAGDQVREFTKLHAAHCHLHRSSLEYGIEEDQSLRLMVAAWYRFCARQPEEWTGRRIMRNATGRLQVKEQSPGSIPLELCPMEGFPRAYHWRGMFQRPDELLIFEKYLDAEQGEAHTYMLLSRLLRIRQTQQTSTTFMQLAESAT